MSRTILLADDSVTIQKVVELTFMEEEVEIVAVGSGEEAVEKLGDLTPSLVIADVHMPGPDGFELCRMVKEDRPEVPVLLLVGTFEAFDPLDVEQSGADGYLKKPFDSQELIRRVEELLAGAEAVAPEVVEEEPESAPVGEAETAPEMAAAKEDRDEIFTTSSSRSGDLLKGVDDEIEALADFQQAPPYSGKATAPPSAHPAQSASQAAESVSAATENGGVAPGLSEDDIDRIARRVVELLGDGTLREVAWEVVPDLAEVVIKDRLRELEGQVE